MNAHYSHIVHKYFAIREQLQVYCREANDKLDDLDKIAAILTAYKDTNTELTTRMEMH